MRYFATLLLLCLAACGGQTDPNARTWSFSLWSTDGMGTVCTGTVSLQPGQRGLEGPISAGCVYSAGNGSSMLGTLIVDGADVELEIDALGPLTIAPSGRQFYFEGAASVPGRIDGDGTGWDGLRWHLVGRPTD